MAQTKVWVPRLTKKQAQIFDNYSRFLLVSGPKRSGKTIGCAHRLLRHAWENNNARIAVFAKTTKLAKDGGVWADIVDLVLPEWLDSGLGMELVTAPKVDGQTRQLYMEVSNKHGTLSRISLNSLDYDEAIEQVIKGRRFSMIWFNELSNFRSRRVFDISADQLRCPWLEFSDHQWMADTNPAEEGEDSWIYKLWYGERLSEPSKAEASTESESASRSSQLRSHLDLIEVMIEDNPFLSAAEVSTLKAQFAHDPDLYARYIEGRWTRASADGIFADVFKPGVHIRGDTSDPDPSCWSVLVPEKLTTDLVVGWDIGQVCHAVVIVEPVLKGGQLAFKILDEIVHLNDFIGLRELTEEVMDRMASIEQTAGRTFRWRHWSDRSAFDNFRPAAETYDCKLISSYSDGRINLMAAPKFPGAIAHGIRLMRQLLFENRLYVSANCSNTIAMFRSLRSGRQPFASVDRNSPHRHIFDAQRYAITSELPTALPSEPAVPHSRGSLLFVP